MKYYVYIFSCVLCNIAANLLIKSGTYHAASPYLLGILSWRSLGGLGVFGASAVFYVLALKNGPLNLSQSIAILQYVGVLVGAHLLFGEIFSFVQVVGAIFLCLGVFLIVIGVQT